MTQNDAEKTHKCVFCLYCSKRRFDLKRHHNAKHKDKLFENNDSEQIVQNVCPNEQNVCPNVQNVCPNVQNVCPMCFKKYKTKRHLNKHKSLCKGIDELTCSKCMISFTTRSAKHKHIKRNNCSARSVIHYHNKNIQNIIQNQNIYNTTNNTNNLIINNFGSERIDHISQDDIVKMLTSGLNTIPLYIEKKHFDKEFPENNNITFTNENKCKVMENNKWKERDIGTLSSKLIQDNSEVLLLYCDNNEMNLLNVLQDEEKFKFIKHKLFIVYDKSESQKYNEILSKIKDLIKNSKL
jgi:hypothetical protein